MMTNVKFTKGEIPTPLEVALQIVETLGTHEIAVLPKKPSVEYIRVIMTAGNVNEATAREIYSALVTAAG